MSQILILTGNLGRDPEMKYLDTGKAVTNFSIATSKKWKDQQGNQNEVTCWFNVSTYGKLAENCNQYLRKGSKVQVVGEMRPDKKTGGPRVYEKSNSGGWGASFDVDAKEVEFLSPVGERSGNSQAADEESIPF